MTVELRCDIARGRGNARALKADALRLLRLSALEECELSLMIVGDRAMRSLNRRFRGKDRPTDVLSFSQLEEVARAGMRGRIPGNRPTSMVKAAPGRLLGDVVISIETARRQAREMDVPVAKRLRTLLVHGFLHVLGYDHERSAAAAKTMFARERKLIAMFERVDDTAAAPVRAPAARARARTGARR